jgi:glycine/D-amino acid oxidase-like deaminating enzyme
MNETFCIVGAGGFGLMTAMHLRETYKDAKITIFDINKELSSTVNGGNGILNESMDINLKDMINSFSINLLNIPYKFDFYMIHFINYIFNNSKNRAIIKQISSNVNNDCPTSDYYPKNYWDEIINKLMDNNIKIVNMTEIIDYKYNDKIIIVDNNKNEYECDKLILCTGGNLKLIKKKYYHKFIDIFSGYSSIVKVKNVPKCFYYKDGIFITPYSNDEIKITFKLQLGTKNDNYYINNNNKIICFIKENPEIKKLGFISINNMWRGSRAISYDIIPFIEQVDKNIYWLSGGSYLGTHLANNFGKWMVDYISNKPFLGLPNNFDPTIKRLKNIRRKYIIRLIIFITLIILVILVIQYKIEKN